MIHLFPSRLTRWMHDRTSYCGCGPLADPTVAVLTHRRFPAEDDRR